MTPNPNPSPEEVEDRCRFLQGEIRRCNKAIEDGKGESWWYQDRDRFQQELNDLRAPKLSPQTLPAPGEVERQSFEALERFITDHEGNDETSDGLDVDRRVREAVSALRSVVSAALAVCHSGDDDCTNGRVVTIDPDAFDALNAALDRVGDEGDDDRLTGEEACDVAVPVAWCSPGQLANLTDVDADGGVYLPIRKTKRGNFIMPLFTTLATVAAADDEGVARALKAAAKVADDLCADMTAEADAEPGAITKLLHRASAQTAGKIAAAIRLLSQGGGK